ncbi:hypothetical protein B0H66DRAFT_533256 [Apodospora peruviana]|uniref:Zn(2)-C6 fungal-type domain-containing protein n=1 Tax=Apodospora peruviana TaxID=516989 RepID=A0AAE0I5M1_9PEZI|nr:hypothetical protein B0H66DRAFT_533256 [Apodospora peruviana]
MELPEAYYYCHLKKLKCSPGRPCQRCVKYGQACAAWEPTGTLRLCATCTSTENEPSTPGSESENTPAGEYEEFQEFTTGGDCKNPDLATSDGDSEQTTAVGHLVHTPTAEKLELSTNDGKPEDVIPEGDYQEFTVGENE